MKSTLILYDKSAREMFHEVNRLLRHRGLRVRSRIYNIDGEARMKVSLEGIKVKCRRCGDSKQVAWVMVKRDGSPLGTPTIATVPCPDCQNPKQKKSGKKS